MQVLVKTKNEEKWFDCDDYISLDSLIEDIGEDEYEFSTFKYERDWETYFVSDNEIDEGYWDIQDALTRYDVSDEVFATYLSYIGSQSSYDWSDVRSCSEAYMGDFNSDADFSRYLHDDDMEYVPDWVDVDWESVAEKDMQGYYEDNHHYFNACL